MTWMEPKEKGMQMSTPNWSWISKPSAVVAGTTREVEEAAALGVGDEPAVAAVGQARDASPGPVVLRVDAVAVGPSVLCSACRGRGPLSQAKAVGRSGVEGEG